MREIEFRGKREDNREWVYGWYYCKPIGDDLYYHYITNKRGYFYNILPETVGQYTGLKDENKTKIFEGDIVRYIWDYGTPDFEVEFYKVEYKQDECIFLACNEYCDSECLGEYNFEVVGNIHDNPELLEV